MSGFPITSLQPLALSLARRYAYNPADVDDLQQVGLFAAHRARQQLRKARQPRALARVIMRRAMSDYYDAHGNRRFAFDAVVLRDDDRVTAQTHLLTEYFEDLERACGTGARRIAQQLVSPSGATAEAILRDAEQRRRRARRSKRAVRGFRHTLPVTRETIRTSLRLAPERWAREMERIRSFTRQWLVA